MKKGILLLLIVSFSLLLYSQTLTHAFVWDDPAFVHWPLVRSFRSIPQFLAGTYPTGHNGKYRPVKGIVLTIDHVLFQENPLGYHIQALLIYAASIVLIYLVTQELTRSAKIALLTSFLFGVHPVHVEAITFITSSMDILGLDLLLLSFYLYLKSFATSEQQNLIILSAMLGFVGFLSNEIALVLPFIITWYTYLFKKVTRKTWKHLLTCISPYWIALGAYGVLRLLVSPAPGDDQYLVNSIYLTGLAMAKVFLKYIALIVAPITLSVNHIVSPGLMSFVEIDVSEAVIRAQSIWEWQVLLGIALLCVIVGAGIYFRRRTPLISFALGWFLFTLVPVSNLVPLPTLMAERYIFLPSYAFMLLGAALFGIFLRKDRMTFTTYGVVVCFIALISFYSVQTFWRNKDWQSPIALWSDAVKKAPDSVLAHHNLGSSYKDVGDYDRAITEFTYAADHISFCYAKIYLNLGNAYAQKNKFEEARAAYEQALRCSPDDFEALYHLGIVTKRLGFKKEAIVAYEKALAIRPFDYDTLINLGALLAEQGNYSEAEKNIAQAIKINPHTVVGYINLAVIYDLSDRTQDAIFLLKKALVLDPNNEEVKSFLHQLGE